MTEQFQEKFSVDSALLKELGEQLVGAPHIALAELIKNSYDADANRVEIEFGNDRIEVSDNGHGMDADEFRTRWMRVGSTHKAAEQTSRGFARPLTGSKGVGRLAAQFLGSRIQLQTNSARNPIQQLTANIDWEQAVNAGELTSATAQYSVGPQRGSFPSEAPSGTTIKIEGLRQAWSAEDFEKLAREIWFLRPPFADGLGRRVNAASSFEIQLNAEQSAQKAFDTQLRRVLDLWMTRIRGRLRSVPKRSMRTPANSKDGLRTPDDEKEQSQAPHGVKDPRRSVIDLLIEFQSGKAIRERFEIPLTSEESDRVAKEAGTNLGTQSLLDSCQFEIRVFDLRNKQRFGIKVGEARAYLNKHGGIHVYDGGFRIPFSGPEADWLGLEIAHSHRLATTWLLPSELRVQGAATYLPTNSRVFGAVFVDTSNERRAAKRVTPDGDRTWYEDHLQIQVSRDRLVRNGAFTQLRYVIVRALEHYATEQAKKRLEEIERQRDVTSPSASTRSALEILSSHRDEMPSRVYRALRAAMNDVAKEARMQAELHQELASHLATFASAGSLALVYDHEVSRQISRVERITRQLREFDDAHAFPPELATIAAEFDEWANHAKSIRSLVRHLSEPDLREANDRFRLSVVLAEATQGARILTRGIPVTLKGIPANARLPRGLYSAWIALFQNLFVNSANAIIAKGDAGNIKVDFLERGRLSVVRVQDTGIGVDLREADSYFDPFVRKLEIPPSRRELAAGGSGLGLTIVRMIAKDAQSEIRFCKPEPGFATAIELQWVEST